MSTPGRNYPVDGTELPYAPFDRRCGNQMVARQLATGVYLHTWATFRVCSTDSTLGEKPSIYSLLARLSMIEPKTVVEPERR